MPRFAFCAGPFLDGKPEILAGLVNGLVGAEEQLDLFRKIDVLRDFFDEAAQTGSDLDFSFGFFKIGRYLEIERRISRRIGSPGSIESLIAGVLGYCERAC